MSQTKEGVKKDTVEIRETKSYLIDEDVVRAAGVKLGDTPSEYCCVIKKGRHFRWKTLEYCVEESKDQASFEIDFHRRDRIRSATCGAKVTAVLCPGDSEIAPVAGQHLMKYTCKSHFSDEIEDGVSIYAA